jgi:protein transport protein SEC24
VQCAVLYTTSGGERRIRVHTLALRSSTDVTQTFRAADLDATVALLTRAAAWRALRDGDLAAARKQLTERVVNALAAYRKECSSSSPPVGLIRCCCCCCCCC